MNIRDVVSREVLSVADEDEFVVMRPGLLARDVHRSIVEYRVALGIMRKNVGAVRWIVGLCGNRAIV